MSDLAHLYARALADSVDRDGVITRARLGELGIPKGTIERWLRAGLLHRVHQSVHVLGRPDLSPAAVRLAAAAAYGPTAVVSHASALMDWEIVGGALRPVQVTVPGSSRHRQRGTVVHRSTTLTAADVTQHGAVPVTTVERSLLDYAGQVTRARLLRALEQAERLRLFDTVGLLEVLARNPGAPGARRLRAALRNYTGAPDTRSELERAFLEFVQARGLPVPLLNVMVAGQLADAYWPRWSLVVELDSVAWHLTRRALQTDRLRDVAYQRAGLRVLRLTHARLTGDPDGVYADILALAALARAA